jgi:hypothetical protein
MKDLTMNHEPLTSVSIVTSLDLDCLERGPGPKRGEHDVVRTGLATICNPRRPRAVRVFGRAHHIVHRRQSLGGTFWRATANGGAEAEILLVPLREPSGPVLLRYELGRFDGIMKLTAAFDPTTIMIGNSTGAAALPESETGEIPRYPSSDPRTTSLVLAMGFDLLDDLSRQVTEASSSLYRPATIEKIRRGEFEVIRAQWRASLSTDDIPFFLQAAAQAKGRAIAKGRGVQRLDDHSGLEFAAYAEGDTADSSGATLCKRNRVATMRRSETHSSAERAMIGGNFYLDVTADVAGITTIVEAAKRRLEHLGRLGHAQSWGDDWVDEFQSAGAAPTARLLSRAIFVLSQRIVSGEMMRSSFARWLIPHMLRQRQVAAGSP